MIQDGIFLLISGLVLLGAILAVCLRNVFYNALSLGLALLGIAGLYLYLNSEFVAAMQVIVYVGAVAVAIIFAIMLSQPMSLPQISAPRLRTFRSFTVTVILFALVTKILLGTSWPPAPDAADYSVKGMGEVLLTRYVLPFEVISLILLIAIIGALMISRRKEQT